MLTQWKSFAVWVAAILVIVGASLLYQPAAAKTGSLLVWTRNRVYVMDIDTLDLQRVGPATADQQIVLSPGCYQLTEQPCRVLVDETLYRVDLSLAGSHRLETYLPIGQGYRWAGGAASWSPDGVHLAYSVVNEQNQEAELRIYNVATGETALSDSDIDASVAVAWTPACTAGLQATGCELGYKKMPVQVDNEFLPALTGYSPASGEVRRWFLSTEPVFELRWSPEGMLLYSRPKRHFKRADDHTLAHQLPPGSQLASMSPDTRHTVYYQPFRLEGCQQSETDDCLHVGVWLKHPPNQAEEPRSLIYSLDLEAQAGGLNFIPTWSPQGDGFVFFQNGELIYYDLQRQEGEIWYKPVVGKLRSVPVFSPNEEAVAFVDNQGQGYSDYRLVVVNPRLEPVEHIIETESGFRILAWLPN